ncbi:hypothetical protein SUBVAR_05629 [Subdoligranulum variabile DSM 15176]|uniref:Uncharacterized protein n=1 Tax=Subdoligranulum variabile DSM 15176 TaxID=411471 RepID=D1PMR5_9FIRM|nr:hypothetical protein SUBVAR_05629 [Subdoligranulum variabile DSM 15176]
MSNKAQRLGIFLPGCGRKRSIHIAVLIHMGILQAEAFQFLHQLTGQVKLARCAGMCPRIRVGSGIYLYIMQQSFIRTHEIWFLLVQTGHTLPVSRFYGSIPQKAAISKAVHFSNAEECVKIGKIIKEICVLTHQK